MRASNLTLVQVEYGLSRAQVIESYLESYGIPVVLDYESAGPAIGVTIDGLGEVRILVPSRRARRARRLLMGRQRPVPYRRRTWRRIRERRDRR